ncbi:hypothetical protein CASFOL_040818 [Castilleja foliolosa]|uniref:Uncharacterized protein n=1 Tax=Castilleja foliolosa TaxID=1961234 RepID=A0ABD3BD04_9LAMI
MVFVNGGQSERRFKLKGFDLASGCGGAMRARGGAGMEVGFVVVMAGVRRFVSGWWLEGEWAQMWLGHGGGVTAHLAYGRAPITGELKALFYETKEELHRVQLGWGEEFQSMGHHVKGLEVAASSYHKVLEQNRLLYNQVQDLKEEHCICDIYKCEMRKGRIIVLAVIGSVMIKNVRYVLGDCVAVNYCWYHGVKEEEEVYDVFVGFFLILQSANLR